MAANFTYPYAISISVTEATSNHFCRAMPSVEAEKTMLAKQKAEMDKEWARLMAVREELESDAEQERRAGVCGSTGQVGETIRVALKSHKLIVRPQ
jgi:hypothetical protein